MAGGKNESKDSVEKWSIKWQNLPVALIFYHK